MTNDGKSKLQPGDVIENGRWRQGFPTSIYSGFEYETGLHIEKGELMLIVEVGFDLKEIRVMTSLGPLWVVVTGHDIPLIRHTNICDHQ